jgi:methylmalonyl-CoA mutase C-terminal domain/subunit
VIDRGSKPIRVLIAKPGLDGHDRGAYVVARALRDAGMEVIYTGLHQTIAAIAQAAVDEDVRIVGLSVLSGAHVPLTRRLMKALKRLGADDKLVIVGGTIPAQDVPTLRALGVQAVFPVGTPLPKIVAEVRALADKHEGVA